jgi:hypothetical protein
MVYMHLRSAVDQRRPLNCARYVRAFAAAGKLCATHKSEGRGLHPTQLAQMMQAAQKIGERRITQLKALVDGCDKIVGPEKLLERQIFF